MALDHRDLLQLAAPHSPVTTQFVDKYGLRARLDLSSCASAQIAYLDQRETGLELAVYPGDTLSQARILYADPPRCQRLLALRDYGWAIRPNFHFGFASKGLTWTTSALKTDEYVAYWIAHIDTAQALHRDDWDSELQRLINDGIFNDADNAAFTADFRATRRATASPRPGLLATRFWPHLVAADADFPGMLRAALIRILTALDEPTTALRERP